jgi:peptide/nickel transport system substrate-binding protein
VGKFAIAFLILVSLALAACSDSKDSSFKPISLPKTLSADQVGQGGELTIGAEQEPDCLDFLDLCSGSSWGFWMVAVNTLPRVYTVSRVTDNGKPTNRWEYKTTSLVTGDPVLDTSGDQKVTYTINPKAVWSDGEPITGEDFVYTADQLQNGENIYDRTGYTDIKSVTVDKSDDHKVTVTWSKPYAGWKTLFGGNYGVLPSHLLKGKDRNALMVDGYTFSGGPWKLQAWNKGENIVLVPNDKYWGDKPKLDKVTFNFLTDSTSEFKSFQDGEVSVIYPQPQIDVIDQINQGGLTDAYRVVNSNTGSTEALWLNNDAAPFDNVKVRQALAYSIDRDKVVKTLFGGIGVTKALNSFTANILPDYQNLGAFEKYTVNKSKADSLLKDAGYKKNSKGVYTKGGKELSFTIMTTEGNQRRQLTMETIQKQLQDLGWKVKLNPVSAGDLFGNFAPSGQFQAAIYAQVLTVLDPGNCTLFCAKNIPTDANGNSGNNWTRTDVKKIDSLLNTVDSELNASKREKAAKDSDAAVADDVASLPIDPLPNILLWKKTVLGPVDENPIQGPFFNLNEWGIKKK